MVLKSTRLLLALYSRWRLRPLQVASTRAIFSCCLTALASPL
jgi:hypothetical protein